MSKLNILNSLDLYKELKKFRTGIISVKKNFPDQVQQIDNLLENDKTGLVGTVVDFMIHSSTVNMKIETENDPLNKLLQNWQKNVLNTKVNIDIPSGLRALSTENFRERWRSSQLALKVIWGEQKFENQKPWIVPKKMWFLDGSTIITESNGALNTRKFFVNINKKKVQLTNSKTESIFIRKPYNSWHKDIVTPYLVKRGTVFNSLVKNAIVEKQSEVIESIIPLILQIKAGSDELALRGLGVSEKAFKKLKDGLVEAKNKFAESHDFGDLIASLRHDVNLEYLIPDISKIFDDKIVRSTDRNLLSSLGMIELQGFSSDRQEAILNPKVLVEEVSDAVMDWADLLQDVMLEMMDRNRAIHPNLANNEIQVIPGIIKAFITDEMRTMLRSMYDRGVISKQDGCEDITGLNFEVQVNRRTKENERDLQTIMKPPVIQNIEKDLDPLIDDINLEDQDKKPNTPESDNFNQSILREYFNREHIKRRKKKKCVPTKDKKCPPKSRPSPKYSEYIIQTPDDLPEEIKKLSFPAQLTYFMIFNSAIDFDDKTPEEAHKLAMESIQMFITSGKEKLISVTAKAEVKCGNCNAIFDYNSVPEISMGAIECPSCSEIIDQTGKKHLKKKKKKIIAPFENIDELPDNVKNVLPIPAQMIWMKVFNSVFDETGDEERSIRSAWSQVSKTYEKIDDKVKWVKKARLEDYKSEMSPYSYTLFQEMYNTALENNASHSNAIKTALTVIERICVKNENSIWVKNKALTKKQVESIDRPDFVGKLLELELTEKKLKLIDKLLKEDK